MKCPNKKCGYKGTRVREVVIYSTFKYRVRICPNCGTLFQTHERIIDESIVLCNYEPLQEELPFYKVAKDSKKDK